MLAQQNGCYVDAETVIAEIIPYLSPSLPTVCRCYLFIHLFAYLLVYETANDLAFCCVAQLLIIACDLPKIIHVMK